MTRATRNIHLIRKRVPLKCEAQSMGVGICTGVRNGTGPLINKTVQRGSHVMSKRRKVQGGFTRQTAIIATLVQSAALWGPQGVQISSHQLSKFGTCVAKRVWSPLWPTKAKEIIYTLFTLGHRVSPIMKVAYDQSHG